MADPKSTTGNQAGAPNANQNAAQNPAAAQRGAAPAAAPAKSGGMAKGLIGGLVAGGLIGMLMGGGLGALGGSGLIAALLQGLLIGGVIWLALRLFRRRSAAPAMTPQMAPAGAPMGGVNPYMAPEPVAHTPASRTPLQPAPAGTDLAITADDQYVFEQLLYAVQDAFGQEDYARLRTLATPEIMSYLAEEMSANATKGLRNSVSQTQLLQADVAEAWSETNADYATVAMRYESIDVMLDRQTGAVVEGNPTQPTQTTELWTFVRDGQNPWRLSAIQQA